MIKEKLMIPFKNGKPVWYQYEPRDEERENYEFKEKYIINYFSRGRSSCKMILRSYNDYLKNGLGYSHESNDIEVFMTDAPEIISKMINGVIEDTFTFVKRGTNYGVKLANG